MDTVSISLDRQTLHRPSPTWRPKIFGGGIVTDAGNTTGSGVTKIPPGEPFEVSAEEAAALLRVHARQDHFLGCAPVGSRREGGIRRGT